MELVWLWICLESHGILHLVVMLCIEMLMFSNLNLIDIGSMYVIGLNGYNECYEIKFELKLNVEM